MDNEITKIKENIKQKRIKTISPSLNAEKFFLNFDLIKLFNNIMLIIVFTLTTLIILSSNQKAKKFFHTNIFEKNFSFAVINKFYHKHFGSPLPFKELFNSKTQQVFEEKLKYYDSHIYKDGVKLIVDQNYLVPALDGGIVIFIGNKDEYNDVVIVQQSDGVDVWYSNIQNINVKLYDYIAKGSLIGEAQNKEFYLVFYKDGNLIDYKTFI